MGRSRSRSPRASRVRLGDPVLDRYLEFVESRCRPNTVLAAASDLKIFFSVIRKPAAEVVPADVLAFITAQRKAHGDGRIVRLVDGESQGEASLVLKGDYQNRYGASSATGSGTENAKAGYSGGTIDGVLWDGDTASAPNMHLQGDWDC